MQADIDGSLIGLLFPFSAPKRNYAVVVATFIHDAYISWL